MNRCLRRLGQPADPQSLNLYNCVYGIVSPFGGIGGIAEDGAALRLTESMSKTQLRRLIVDIDANGLKDNVINYVEVVSKNNRLVAARSLGKTGDLIFNKVDLPFRGFKSEADVINAHADILKGR